LQISKNELPLVLRIGADQEVSQVRIGMGQASSMASAGELCQQSYKFIVQGMFAEVDIQRLSRAYGGSNKNARPTHAPKTFMGKGQRLRTSQLSCAGSAMVFEFH
jgi:hypothetical protein